jgi:hypothetical protein
MLVVVVVVVIPEVVDIVLPLTTGAGKEAQGPRVVHTAGERERRRVARPARKARLVRHRPVLDVVGERVLAAPYGHPRRAGAGQATALLVQRRQVGATSGGRSKREGRERRTYLVSAFQARGG